MISVDATPDNAIAHLIDYLDPTCFAPTWTHEYVDVYTDTNVYLSTPK